MPQNPDREPAKIERLQADVYAHAEESTVAALVIALVIAFTMLGAPLTVSGALLLGASLVYLIQWVRR